MKILRNFCDGCVHKMVCKYREETENLNDNIVEIKCTYRVDIPGWEDVYRDNAMNCTRVEGSK